MEKKQTKQREKKTRNGRENGKLFAHTNALKSINGSSDDDHNELCDFKFTAYYYIYDYVLCFHYIFIFIFVSFLSTASIQLEPCLRLSVD